MKKTKIFCLATLLAVLSTTAASTASAAISTREIQPASRPTFFVTVHVEGLEGGQLLPGNKITLRSAISTLHLHVLAAKADADGTQFVQLATGSIPAGVYSLTVDSDASVQGWTILD